MRRVVACFLVLLACTHAGCTRARDEDALRRFVRAWPAGGSALTDAITGPDAGRLAGALRGLREGGVERADAVRISRREGDLIARVRLRLRDDALLELDIRASLEGGRVLAQPRAISTELRDWQPLRIERFGQPERGAILSRDRTRLAHGERSERAVARRALRPAVALIDEALDAQLAGKRGALLLAGERRVLAKAKVTDGAAVVTSLDDAIQSAAEDAFGHATGALVAVDPRTGGIRALVSDPPTKATSASSPGSTFKVVTAAAALEADILRPNDRISCPSRTTQGERRITNFGGLDYGQITFEKAFAVSCNTAFAQIGVAVGTSRLLRTARRLGFGVGALDQPGTISVPTSRSELAAWSFGAAGSVVSPLQIAGIGSTIARGGVRVTPGWTDRGNTGRRVLREQTADNLATMMEEVVATGTGRNARLDAVRVAGKTGTADAEEATGRSDAWFVGLAPSRGTELVAAALLPGAGIGGQLAATLVGRFFADVVS